MKSILRFVVILCLVFGAALVWKADKRRTFVQAPRQETAVGVNPQEEVDRALRPLRAAPEVPAWSRDEFQGRLSDAFSRNDPCAVIGLLSEEAAVSPQKFLTAGMEVLFKQQRGREDLLEELYVREDSPLFGVPQEDSRRKETRFLNALVESNQLSGYGEEADAKNPHRDTEKAIATFKELLAEEPDNGAYQFFLAQALRQSGEKKTEVERAYANAAEAKKFDPYYQGIYDNLQNLAFDNLATFAWVYSYMQRAPVPDFSAASRNLRGWALSNDTGKWIAGRLAKRLVDVGTRYKANSPGYKFSQIEYLIGQNLKYTVDGRWEKNWEETTEKMREARAFIAETPVS
ncbi:MAG: tetratricopeptide repeat protein, partial [Proteobacteria bacterium]